MKHSLMGRVTIFTLLFFLGLQTSFADTRFVTDRIMLGVHQDADANSTLLTSIPSGTAVDVTGTDGDFSKIRLSNGTEGWVLSSYLLNDKPAVAELDDLSAKYQEANEQARKYEKQAQLWRDEVSNKKDQIKELRKAAGGESFEALERLEKELAKEKEKMVKLEEKLKTSEDELDRLRSLSQEDVVAKLQLIEGQNHNLNVRIQAALANLEGKTVPTPEELAAIRPDFPVWYSLLLVLMIILGIAGGIGWMDYQNRRRHGGFRL
ncbi:MAG: TIGR04211 family SH3 domain-containing protein [Gammaproteobacteria bacterium]|nr:TIGR04211 family SH3 domain-containing protein [Gammaproteobacteria bacterium]